MADKRKGKLTDSEKKERTWLFQKGQSGNPAGRPKKGKTFPDLIESEMQRIQQDMPQKDGSVRKVDGKQMLVITLLRMALFSEDEKVKMQAIEKIMDRLEGKPTQAVDMNAIVDQTNHSVFDEIDVSKLNTQEKKNLENVLKKMYYDSND